MLCAALTIIIIDETVLNVAIPALFRELHATASQVQWAVDAYVLVYASLLFPAGNLGDRYGRRTFLLIGLVVFGAASTVAAWAPNAAVLIGARSVMAVGGALIMPQTLSILVEVFANAQRAMAISVWSAVSGLGIVVGPILGGWLVERYWWGSVFLINVPVVIVTLAASVVLLPNHRDPAASPVDLTGSLLAIVTLLGVLYTIIEFPGRGLSDPVILTTGILGVAAAMSFVRVELRSAHPMLDLRVFRRRAVAVGSLVITVIFLTLQGSGYVITQYLQLLQGRGAMEAGMLYAPTTIGWSLAALASAALTRRFGSRLLVSVSLVLIAGTYFALATLGDTTALALIVVSFTIQGIAMGAVVTPVTDLVMGALPADRAGVASALNDSARQIGGAVGVAVLGSLLAAGFRRGLGRHGMAGRGIDNLAVGLASHDHAVMRAARGSFVTGYRWVMVACALVLLVGAYIAAVRGLDDPLPSNGSVDEVSTL